MRIFIIDTLCSQQKGHNLTALLNNKKLFNELTEGNLEIFCLGSKTLIDTCSEFYDVIPFFQFCYFDVLPLTNEDGSVYQIESFDYATPIDPQHRIKINDLNVSKYRLFHNKMQCRSDVDFERFFHEFDICQDDIVYFPSVDYYSAISIMDSMNSRPSNVTPRLCFRFINVMEHWTTLSDSPLLDIIEKAVKLRSNGYSIALATESIGYSYYIASLSKIGVFQLSYIPGSQFNKIDEKKTMPTVLFPGSQREDKGASRISSIIRECILEFNLDFVNYIVQLPGVHEMINLIPNYRQISAWPTVTIQDSTISNAQMKINYENATCICLPYRTDTYSAFRSSGSLVEAAFYGVPIVSTRCEGFASEIEFFDFGRVEDSDRGIAEAINYYVMQDPDVLDSKSNQSLFRYNQFLVGSYRMALKSLGAL